MNQPYGMTKAYLSGPMRGRPHFNFETFNLATDNLRSKGWVVYSPAENDRGLYPDIEMWEGFANGRVDLCPKFNLESALEWDFQHILKANAIVMLSGWEDSAGACSERFVAEATGRAVYIMVDPAGHPFLDDIQKRMLTPRNAT